MTGLEVLALMDASSGELTQHAYIVMTADKHALDAAHHALLKRHDIPLLEKPFDLNSLLGEVARAARRLP